MTQRTFSWLSGLVVAAMSVWGSDCAQATTVALTTTTHAAATDEEKQLAENLLALMEVEAGRHEHLEIVERQQLSLALHELVLSNSRGDAGNLQLGKLAGADLILTAELLEPDDAGARQMHVRLTEAQTAVIRGETLVPISVVEVEEAAAETVDYLARVANGNQWTAATIAILPFESVERFDRLRPLERGLRDMFTSYFMRDERFRVVQRSSMEQLLSELELVRGGLTRNGQGLEAAPAREATYVLRGEIDERTSAEGNLVVIRAELVEPRTRRVVKTLDRKTRPADVPNTIAEMAAELSKSIADDNAEVVVAKPNGAKEIDRLYRLALRDVFRFIRYFTEDAGYLPLEIPGEEQPADLLPTVDPNSPLGVFLLKKSVDRLESVLFIEPDRLTAALPLAYCLSFHVDGVWRPEQCEQLLRRIRDESTDVELRFVASRLLSDMYFPHGGQVYSDILAKLDPELVELGYARRLEMLVALSKEYPEESWQRLLFTLVHVCKFKDEDARWSELLTTLSQIQEQLSATSVSEEVQNSVAASAMSIAYDLVNRKMGSPSLREEALRLIAKWRESEHAGQRLASTRQLYLLRKLSADEYSATIDQVYPDHSDRREDRRRTLLKVWLAEHLVYKGEVEAALAILEPLDVADRSGERSYDFAYGEYGYQLARCYEMVGRKQEALATYLKYAETPHGNTHGGMIDFEGRIRELGGVPLDENRDVEVSYPEASLDTPVYCKALATNGDRLFCGGGFVDGRLGERAVPILSVKALNIATGVWTNLGGPNDRVSCLAVGAGYLWAGTDHQGLWRMSLANGEWRHWTTAEGLPTNSVIAVETHGETAYVSVANIDNERQVVSGGVVRVDPRADPTRGAIHVYRGADAPPIAPLSMAIDGNRLVVTDANRQLFELNLKSDLWRRRTYEWRRRIDNWSFLVSAGPSGIWTAPRDYLAALLDASEKEQRKFPTSELLEGFPTGPYLPAFMLERDGQLWIGGVPWRRFGDSGLFRLDLETGQLKRYGPREGFRYARLNTYECYDAVWAGDRLWVATSFGLAEVAETHAGR